MKKVLLTNNEIFLISKAIDYYANNHLRVDTDSLVELEQRLHFCRSARLLLDKLACSEVDNG